MKKLLSILLTAIMLCVVGMTFSSCGTETPELNLDKARKNLKDNGYYVELEDGSSGGWFDYSVEKYLYAEEEDGENWIEIIEFKSVKLAKLYVATSDGIWLENEIAFMEQVLKKYGDDMKSAEKDELEDRIKDDKEELEEEQMFRKGKYVWYGTKTAIKDTKG